MWKFLEKRPFFRADMAGLGSKGLIEILFFSKSRKSYKREENGIPGCLGEDIQNQEISDYNLPVLPSSMWH